jgi:hypothetical protein
MREFKDSISGKDDDEDALEQAKLEARAQQPQPPADAEPVEGEVVADKSS